MFQWVEVGIFSAFSTQFREAGILAQVKGVRKMSNPKYLNPSSTVVVWSGAFELGPSTVDLSLENWFIEPVKQSWSGYANFRVKH